MILDELSAEERAEMVEKLARRVVERRMESPAALFLEMHKPLAFVGGQMLTVAAPMLGALFGFEQMQRLALFIQSPENIEALLVRIEEMSRERPWGTGRELTAAAAPEGIGTEPEASAQREDGRVVGG